MSKPCQSHGVVHFFLLFIFYQCRCNLSNTHGIIVWIRKNVLFENNGDQAEATAAKFLREHLNGNYEHPSTIAEESKAFSVQRFGGMDSTKPDIRITSLATGNYFWVEVKQIPSIAGMQLPLKYAKDRWIANQDKLVTDSPWLQTLVDLANEYSSSASEMMPKRQLTDGDPNIFPIMQAFEKKYLSAQNGGVRLFMGIINKGSTIIVSDTKAESLMEYYTPVLEIRKKKSGTSNLVLDSASKLRLQKAGIVLMEAAGTASGRGNLKYYFHNAADKGKAETILGLEGRLHISKTDGSIKKTSNTNNVNIIVSFSVRDNILKQTESYSCPGMSPQELSKYARHLTT